MLAALVGIIVKKNMDKCYILQLSVYGDLPHSVRSVDRSPSQTALGFVEPAASLFLHNLRVPQCSNWLCDERFWATKLVKNS